MNLPPEENDRRNTLLLAGAIGLLALAMRLWGIEFGLPNVFCGVDENFSTPLAMRFGSGELVPFNYSWPSLHSYMLFALYGVYYKLGSLLGSVQSAHDFQKLYFTDPQSFYIIGRYLSVAAGTASCLALFFLAKKACSLRTAVLAALFISLNFLHIRDSHYSRPDMIASFFMLLTFLRMLSLRTRKDYILTGILAGMTIASKYQFGLVVIPALAAHFLPGPDGEQRPFMSRLKDPSPLIMLLSAFLVFFAATPFTIIHLRTALQHVIWAADQEHFMRLYGFTSAFSFHFQYSFLQGMGLPLMLASLFGIIRALRRPTRAGILLLVLAAVNYLAITLTSGVYMRYAIPLLYPLFIFAAEAADYLIGAVERRRLPGPLKKLFMLLLPAALLYQPARKAIAYDWLLTQKDNRVVAAEWIEANIPDGSRLTFTTPWPADCPVLRQTKESLSDDTREIVTGYRHKFLLALPDYPRKPAYYITQLYEEGWVMLWYRGIKTDVKKLKADIKAEKVDYIVSLEHYPGALPNVSPQLTALIGSSYTLYKEILPYSGDAPPEPLFDEPSGYYLPCAGFERLLRPGPIIRIWKTSPPNAGKARVLH